MKVTILGSGAWGMGLATIVQETADLVHVWTIDKKTFDHFQEKRSVPRLDNIFFKANVRMTFNLEEAVDNSDLIILSIPVPHIRSVCKEHADLLKKAPIISTSKGIEKHTGFFATEIVQEFLSKKHSIAALSGPNFAFEIANKMPSSTSIACTKEQQSFFAQFFDIPRFRIMFNEDIVGTQVGGALKNVFAILSGIAVTKEYGMSSVASLLTRGLQEMSLFGKDKGANPVTFLSLSGVGDLILTCLGDLSRNYTFGCHIGHGFTPQEALEKLGTVEGYHTTFSLSEMRIFERMPVAQTVFNILYNNKNPVEMIDALLAQKFV